MGDRTYVCCHSPSLALLLFETVCSVRDQKGLLLGTVENHVITSTTDENEAIEEEKTVIYVEHCVPMPDVGIFGPYGELSEEFLLKCYEPHRNKIVGWYSFRRNQKSTRCSLREYLIHKALLRTINPVASETFILGLLSASTQPSLSTHAYNHTFLRMNRRDLFDPLRFKIYSLSDKLTSNSGYLKNLAFPTAEGFRRITNLAAKEENSAFCVRKINNVANDNLIELSKQLLKWETQRKLLEKEVNGLKKMLSPPQPTPVKITSTPVVKKEELTPRLIKFNPIVDYTAGRSDNPMRVSDNENSDEEEAELPQRLTDAEDIENEVSQRISPPAAGISKVTPATCLLSGDGVAIPRVWANVNDQPRSDKETVVRDLRDLTEQLLNSEVVRAKTATHSVTRSCSTAESRVCPPSAKDASGGSSSPCQSSMEH